MPEMLFCVTGRYRRAVLAAAEALHLGVEVGDGDDVRVIVPDDPEIVFRFGEATAQQLDQAVHP